MKLEQQVVSLELAKKMKELGFEQESLFYWQLEASDYASEKEQIVPKEYLNKIFTPYSAYTVAELGEILGIHRGEPFRPQYAEETEADYRANHAVYLKKNNLI